MWRPGPVSVGDGMRIGGWLRDDGVGAVYVHDGGNFGFPGASGWVTFSEHGVVVHTFFTPGVPADPARPPFATEPVAAAPAPVALPVVPAPVYRHKPPRADRVRIGGNTYAVIVSPQADGALWRVKGTVDGRVFRSTGSSEVAALASWTAAVKLELDL